ncbi:MAG: hypothetical protein F4153_08785, partial [Acidimicrobiia bacterium]|nr:hypothetical protein [Acidimicrobiia bacterium]
MDAENRHCALRERRHMECWREVHEGRFAATATGDNFRCGLRTDQTVACWGNNRNGQLEVPGSQYTG